MAFSTVKVPLYVPAAVLLGIVTVIGVAGNVTMLRSVKPADTALSPVVNHVIEYWSGLAVVPVYVISKPVAPSHTSAIVPKVIVGKGSTVTVEVVPNVVLQFGVPPVSTLTIVNVTSEVALDDVIVWSVPSKLKVLVVVPPSKL